MNTFRTVRELPVRAKHQVIRSTEIKAGYLGVSQIAP